MELFVGMEHKLDITAVVSPNVLVFLLCCRLQIVVDDLGTSHCNISYMLSLDVTQSKVSPRSTKVPLHHGHFCAGKLPIFFELDRRASFSVFSLFSDRQWKQKYSTTMYSN